MASTNHLNYSQNSVKSWDEVEFFLNNVGEGGKGGVCVTYKEKKKSEIA